MKCNKCKEGLTEASAKGKYFSRVNDKGQPGVFECTPYCEFNDKAPHANDDAVIRAVETTD